MSGTYRRDAPTRAEIDAMPGPVVLEFGTSWCGFCQAAQHPIGAALADFPGVTHLKIEDGKGFPTGRSFAVRQWPTLVFLYDGQEKARVVRPNDARTVTQALAKLSPSDTAAPP